MSEEYYISVPMSGRQTKDIQLDIARAKARLVRLGFVEAVNQPRYIDPLALGETLRKELRREPSYREYIDNDLRWIDTHRPTVVLCPGWANSTGCRAERLLARTLKLDIINLDEHALVADEEVA